MVKTMRSNTAELRDHSVRSCFEFGVLRRKSPIAALLESSNTPSGSTAKVSEF